MTYQCPHCSQPIAADAKFCPNCGGPLSMSARRTVPSLAADGRSFGSPRSVVIVVAAVVVVVVVALVVALVFGRGAGPAKNLLHNASLEEGTGQNLTCWAFGGFGDNTFTWSRTSEAHSGTSAVRLDVTRLSTGDRKLVTTQDAGACAPAVVAGRAYSVNAWYTATVPAIFFVYYRDAAGTWNFWAESPAVPTASAWSRAIFTAPVVPDGATSISVGLGIAAVGSMTVDDFELVEVD